MRSSTATCHLALLAFLTACVGSEVLAPAEGHLRVSLSMAGLDLDPDGALVIVDGRPPASVAPHGSITLSMRPGRHTIELLGVAGNCTVDGAASREVEVRYLEVTDVAFAITCGATAGVVEVAVSTQGPDPDPDGYLVRVDGGLPQRVVSGTRTRFAPVSGGTHAVTVSDVADNCAVAGDNPVAGVQVTTGGLVRDTARVAVTVACTALFGNLRLVTSTEGPPDLDGFVITLGPGPTQSFRLEANDTLLVPNLAVGVYNLGITDIAGHCALTGTPPGSVTIVGGEMAEARFTVACVPPALLRVTAQTTGPDPDPGYMVRIDGGTASPLPAGTTLSLELAPGAHSVELTDVAPNCSVGSPNPADVVLSAGAPADLVFTVTCTAAARTGIDITITTTGGDPDWSYRLTFCLDFYCYQAVFSEVVPANTTLQLDLAPGTYEAYLGDVADNCQYTWTGGTTVTAGQVTAVRIEVTCVAHAAFAVTVTTTGTDRQDWFLLTVDGRSHSYIAAGAPTTLPWLAGDHAIGLANVQGNCRVTSPNPVTATLAAGIVTPVGFSVECAALPILNVSVSTTGTNPPDSYLVGVDPDPWYGGYQFSTRITPNGTATVRLGPGPHSVWLDQVPANCTVGGANPILVDLGLDTTTDVAFAVTCR